MKKLFNCSLLILSLAVSSYAPKPTSFLVPVAGSTTLIGVVTNAASPCTITVTIGSDTLLNNVSVPAGRKATAMPYYAVHPDGDNIEVFGITALEFERTVSGQ